MILVTGSGFKADVNEAQVVGMVELAAHRSAASEPGAGGLSVEVEQAFRAHLKAATEAERSALAARGVVLP